MRHITLITTGGTIEKTYDVSTGVLVNRQSVVRRMLGQLRLEGITIKIVELMSKDSLHMTDEDRAMIVEAVREALAPGEQARTSGIVILHGTDTLSLTGELLDTAIREAQAPIILTGAMRPYEMKQSDALQNLNEAIFATGILAPGVYCVAHGNALKFPGVIKDREIWTFVKKA